MQCNENPSRFYLFASGVLLLKHPYAAQHFRRFAGAANGITIKDIAIRTLLTNMKSMSYANERNCKQESDVDLDRLREWTISAVDQDYTAKDTILYALGLGYGADPTDESELSFVFEDGLKAVPAMCNTLAHPGFWLQEPSLDVDWVKILHGEQGFVIHRPLPGAGRVRGDYRILGVEDKGAAKGAILTLEKRLVDRDDSQLYCTLTTTLFLRGDGGHGGFGEPQPPPAALPDRAPDLIVDLPTLPQAALIYRLSGDYNPLHASPTIARAAGFDRPILQGLCTMGVAARALLKGLCGNQPERLRTMYVRFSRPMFPGETLRTEVFQEAGVVRFRCRVVERDLLVLDRGSVVID